MKLSVAIMAHHKRANYVEELLRDLDYPATVVWDETEDRWDTGRRAVMAYDPDAQAHCVIQDDAVVSRDLCASVEKAIKVVPNNPISLFFSYGTNGAHQRTNCLARTANRPGWVVFEGPWWGVAVVFPVALIPQMIELADRPRASRAYDKRLSGALVKMGIDTYYILPSLVDHRVDGPSLIEGREQNGRRAHHFIGSQVSALTIPWTRLPITNGHKPGARRVPRKRITSTRPVRPAPPTLPSAPVLKPLKVSVAVMAHRSREALVEPLVDALGGAEVVWDTKGDRWDTGRRAMEAFDPSADVHLVVQEDAIVCRDLVAGVAELTRYTGELPVSLYTGRQKVSHANIAIHRALAAQTGAPFYLAPGPHWGVAVVMPTGLIPRLVAGAEALRGIRNYDMRMERWLRAQRIDTAYTVPSLVDHRTDVPSLLGHADKGRVAFDFIGEDASALDVDWGRAPSPPPESGYVELTLSGKTVYACFECLTWRKDVTAIQAHMRRHRVGVLATHR